MRNVDTVEREYALVSNAVKENVFAAKRWAQDRLMRLEGEGHHICISRASSQDNRIVCSFAKPSWPGDHCGTPQYTGAEAIVRAVIEYEHGW